MTNFTAIAVKRYLETRLGELLNNYGENIIVVYGPAAQDNLAVTLVIGDVEQLAADHSSFGPRPKIEEEYNVECALLVAQGDGTVKDTDATAEEVFDVIFEEVRTNPTLGQTVHFSRMVPSRIRSAAGVNGGALTLYEFVVNCRRNLA
jgi:hypothetical protein